MTGASTDRLTFNLGVRYTLAFPSTEKNNQGAVFNLATQQLDYLGAQSGQSGYLQVRTRRSTMATSVHA